MTATVVVPRRLPAQPELSALLSAALRDVLTPPACIAGQRVTVPAPVLAEAEAAAAIYARLCAPAEPAALRRWLAPINAAVRNPRGTAAEFDLAVAAIAEACADIPASVLTQRTLREALQSFQFWPAAADVYALLSAHAAPLRATLRALTALQLEPPPPPPRPGLEEREAILADFHAAIAPVRAKLRAVTQADEPPGHMAAGFNGFTGPALEALRAGNPLVQAARRMAADLAGSR